MVLNIQPIFVASRRTARATLARLHPDATVIDVTSKGDKPWVRFSPFFPHGGIPIPNSDDTAESVEGLWQGLKVFEKEDIDPRKWLIKDMSGIKRGGPRRGTVLGHRMGPHSEEMLNYREARLHIYLPVYNWVLKDRLSREVETLEKLVESSLWSCSITRRMRMSRISAGRCLMPR